jgi:hypothetical protein
LVLYGGSANREWCSCDVGAIEFVAVRGSVP